MNQSIQKPKPATLRRYGLSLGEWQTLLDEQHGVCFVCQRLPATGRLCVDHEHVPGWRKMPAERRKLFVRGILCWGCNLRHLAHGITLAKAKNVVKYLERYLLKRDSR